VGVKKTKRKTGESKRELVEPAGGNAAGKARGITITNHAGTKRLAQNGWSKRLKRLVQGGCETKTQKKRRRDRTLLASQTVGKPGTGGGP